MKPKRFYVAGNPLVSMDSVPIQLMPRLRERFPKIEFVELDPTEDMPEERTLHLIDTMIGIERVRVLEDIDHIISGKAYSLHDFDLGFTLKLMKKAGKLKNVRIIGVPADMTEEKAFGELEKTIRKMV